MIKHPHRTVFFGLFLIGLVLKLMWLGRNELAHDEPFTVYWALQPFDAFKTMLRSENNPPLHFMLMRAWAAMVPLDPAWLRLPSAMFSAVAAIPLMLLADRYGGLRAAVAAAVLFTFNDLHYGFAHEVRAYSLFTLLTITAFWQLARMGAHENRAHIYLLMMNVLLVYTHFFGWAVVGLQLLMIAFIKELRPLGRRWAWVLGGTAIAYLPYAWTFLQRASQGISKGTWLKEPQLEEVYNMLWRWSNAPVITVLLLLLIGWGVVRTKARGTGIGLGLIWTFVPLLGLFLVSFVVPLYLDRYLVFAAPGWALLAGLSVAMLPPRWSVAGIGALSVGLLLSFHPWAQSPHRPSQVVARVHELRAKLPCSQLLVVPPWYRLTYQFAENPDRFRAGSPDLQGSYELEPWIPGCANVILVDADPPDEASQNMVRELRSTNLLLDSVEASYKVRVLRFQHPGE